MYREENLKKIYISSAVMMNPKTIICLALFLQIMHQTVSPHILIGRSLGGRAGRLQLRQAVERELADEYFIHEIANNIAGKLQKAEAANSQKAKQKAKRSCAEDEKESFE